ncbi:hypothetical protein ACFL1X_05170 [Candidatus Hydrogenedentota bacterium]
MKFFVIFILALSIVATAFSQSEETDQEQDELLSSTLFGDPEPPKVRPPERDASDGETAVDVVSGASGGVAQGNAGKNEEIELEKELSAVRDEIKELERQLSEASVASKVGEGTVDGAPLWLWDLTGL